MSDLLEKSVQLYRKWGCSNARRQSAVNAVLYTRNVFACDEARVERQKERINSRLRPYHVEYTRSRPISEVKLRRAQLVLTWVTGWEYLVC